MFEFIQGSPALTLNGLDVALDGATTIFPEEAQSYDMVLIQQDDGIKCISLNDLAGALGSGYMGGWSPAYIGGSAIALDFGRRDTLYLNTTRTSRMLFNGTNELVAGVTELSGNAKHLSQSTSTQRPRYNSSALVNSYGYIETTSENDVQMQLASGWTPGANWSICWGAYVPAAGLKADWTFPVFCGIDTGQICVGYNADGDVRLWRMYGGNSVIASPVPLDAWHHVVMTYDTAVGLKVWVNSVAQTVDDLDIGRTYAAVTGAYIMRETQTGVDSASGCRLAYLFANQTTFDTDQVALVNAWADRRLGL